MIKQVRGIITETYFDKRTNLITACIELIVSSIFITIAFSIGTFIFLGVIGYVISYIFLLIGIIGVLDKIIQIALT